MSVLAVEPLCTSQTPATRILKSGDWVRTNWMPLLVTAALFIMLYTSNFAKLFEDWRDDENYSHGFIVPLVFGWMLWQRREKLSNCRMSPRPWALLIVFFAVIQLVAGTLGAENFVAHCSMLVMLCGIVLFLFGGDMFRTVAFPIAWLLFMIPLPSIIFYRVTFPLQLLASKLAVGILDILHVPSVCEGNVIYLANFTAGVAEACSGIRSLMSIFAFAVLMGYLLSMSLRSRFLLAVAAIPIALGMNAARIAGTGLVGNYVNADWTEGFFHTFSGFLLFVGCIGLMTILVYALRRLERGPSPECLT
jgi:exosortase